MTTAEAQMFYEGVDSGFPAPSGDTSVLPVGSKLMRLWDGGCALTEGVAAGHDGYMYFSDITFTKFCKDPTNTYLQAGNIWRYDPRSGNTTIYRSPSGMSNGIKFDTDGNMIAALGADYGGRMLIKTEMATGRTFILSGLFRGRPYNALNDITIDEQGRIYFSDPRYLGHEPVEQPGFAIYRLDTDGSVHRIVTAAGKTNGVLVSPDQKTFYVVSNDNGFLGFMQLDEGEGTLKGHHLLQAFDLAADGTVSNRRVLIDYAPDSGPDGLVADIDGNIYVAERSESRPGIAVRTVTGKELAFISTGQEMPTNVGFGRGAEADVLYVTSGKSLYKIKMAKKGYELP
ncbi:MAG: SMP-30/gluconolactonase/LRE family protein [Alphaproteobacteria bacterium]|nr:SMP-30/gluconolactonase/LRE family protein [Alphaproteobacteria bacterium]MDP6238585.1 SMP-30/gluconolactonase/LRE family protein [Alphaproteobacteria bacterium]MDP7173338.1 SMP-30/gluconolactonase/LRE family protein [Alphaproteobacteria bacterium]MDP7234710.1 SMP-30/gluconolactonase/LRE family protein [Alphaproteobacteria bacterium]MDP7487789.1 SMP-30/gluconolactonase/LRE family protein [Alphaproteobacteria bacterium]